MASTDLELLNIREVGCRLNQMRPVRFALENDLVFHESPVFCAPCPQTPLFSIPMDGVNAGMIYGRATDTLAIVGLVDVAAASAVHRRTSRGNEAGKQRDNYTGLTIAVLQTISQATF